MANETLRNVRSLVRTVQTISFVPDAVDDLVLVGEAFVDCCCSKNRAPFL